MPAVTHQLPASPLKSSTATTAKPATVERNIENVVLGDITFKAWYPSPYTKDLVGGAAVEERRKGDSKPEFMLERLFICQWCFRYTSDVREFVRHGRCCERKPGVGLEATVPGRKIYTHGREGVWSIWEVDGEVDTLYCQLLSLFAKLFLDNKSVFFDVTGFYYFLLVHTDLRTGTEQVVGFFSKEKMSWDNNNLACILIFPPWQKKGLGALLIAVSYEISRRAEVLGGPEKPISDLGKKGYITYWGREIARYLLGIKEGTAKTGKGSISLEEISRNTWIAVDDCLMTLREIGVATATKLTRQDTEDVHKVMIEKEHLRRWVAQKRISLSPLIDKKGFLAGYDDLQEFNVGMEDQ